MLDLVDILAARGISLPSSCALPALTEPRVFDPLTEWDQRAALLKHGVDVVGTPGAGSQVIVDAAAAPAPGRLRVEFFGGRDQLVVVDGRQKVEGYARLEASAQTLLVAAGGAGPFHAHSIILRGRHTCVAIGAQATSNGVKLLVDGDETSLTIGDDSMLAHDIEILATDSHAMFDVETLAHLNPPASIVIGRHVWIGSQVSVLKGVTIGDGAIIGTKSLLNKSVPPCSLFAGVPARQMRAGVSWSRHLVPNDEEKRAVLRSLGG